MGDRILRAMTNDGAFRVMTVRSTDTVQQALDAQEADPAIREHLGNLLSAAIVFRETMAPGQRVQAFLRGREGSGVLIADSHPDGWGRVMAQLPRGAAAFDLGEGALLQMARSLPNGQLHQGVVEVPGKSISEGLMQYMQLSEQITTMARFDLVLEGSEIKAAGGYLVQLLPEAPDREGPVLLMAQRLEDDFADIRQRLLDSDANPDELMNELLYGMEFTHLHDSEIEAGCDCSRERVMGSLATLGRDDIQELLSGGEPLEMNCDWCNTTYVVELAELQGMAEPS